MPGEIKKIEIKKAGLREYIRKFIMGFQLISSIALGVFVVAILILSVKYFDVPLYGEEETKEAQKIGNWEFPDGNYVLKNFGDISAESKSIRLAEIKDKKSGNAFMVFEAGFSPEEVLRTKDKIQNGLLETYGLGKFYLKSRGEAGRYGEIINYNNVGWAGKNAKLGIIGDLDCLKNKKSGDIIFIFVASDSAKYNEQRALEFVNTLNCPAVGGNGNGDGEVNIKSDVDGDGLPDIVEKMLGTNPYNADTDGDGFSDFEEIKNGHDPLKPRPWDTYSPEEFEKVKKDIKYLSEDIYRKLF